MNEEEHPIRHTEVVPPHTHSPSEFGLLPHEVDPNAPATQLQMVSVNDRIVTLSSRVHETEQHNEQLAKVCLLLCVGLLLVTTGVLVHNLKHAAHKDRKE